MRINFVKVHSVEATEMERVTIVYASSSFVSQVSAHVKWMTLRVHHINLWFTMEVLHGYTCCLLLLLCRWYISMPGEYM